MPWSGGALLDWFAKFLATPEAERLVRSTASKHDIRDLADDLRQEWFLSIHGTVGRLEEVGASLPDWVADEPHAVRYVCRALRNDAIDLVRTKRRNDGRRFDIDSMEVEVEIVDRRPQPDVTATIRTALDAIRREIADGASQGRLGSSQCRNDMVAVLSYQVIERLIGEHHVDITEGEVSGGTNEWDRTVYAALMLMDPERFGQVDGRTTPRARAMKLRCGNRAREVLQELFARYFPEPTGGWA